MPSRSVNVVLKVVQEEHAAAAFNEARVYEHIQDFMSGLVPKFVGLYRSYPSCPVTLYIVVTEYDDKAWTKGTMTGRQCKMFRGGSVSTSARLILAVVYLGRDDLALTCATRSELRTIVTKLHESDVVHNDIELRHLHIHPVTRKLQLIDFSHAKMDATAEELDREMQSDYVFGVKDVSTVCSLVSVAQDVGCRSSTDSSQILDTLGSPAVSTPPTYLSPADTVT